MFPHIKMKKSSEQNHKFRKNMVNVNCLDPSDFSFAERLSNCKASGYISSPFLELNKDRQ